MGLRKTIVIACVSFETAKIVEPIEKYMADEVHLFHHVRYPDSENGKVYQEFYDEVCRQIRQKLPKTTIVDHNRNPIYDFQTMFRDILQTISEIRSRGDEYSEAEILINASAGTTEFGSAAIIASMMSKDVKTFTVSTREYTIKSSDIRDLYYRNGKPVGLTEHIREPRTIPEFHVEMPEENLVRSLRSYYQRSQTGKTMSASCMIKQLKEEGLWEYESNASEKKTDPKQKETMYYQRHYINVWAEKHWIEKSSNYSKYRLTENGMVVINTFYTD